MGRVQLRGCQSEQTLLIGNDSEHAALARRRRSEPLKIASVGFTLFICWIYKKKKTENPVQIYLISEEEIT